MVSLQVQRTLVKSPPELWTELSDQRSLARHFDELGEIRITRTEPEAEVEWETEGASGLVRLEPSGWGTKVTLSLTREVLKPQTAGIPEPAGTEPGDATPEAAGTQPLDATPEPAGTEPVHAMPAQPGTEPVHALPEAASTQLVDPMQPESVLGAPPEREPEGVARGRARRRAQH